MSANLTGLYPGGFNARKYVTFEPATPPEIAFAEALEAFGLVVDGPIVPGKITRTPMADQRRGNKRNGWYLYFGQDHSTNIAAGVFGDWRQPDHRQYWSSKSERDMSPGELDAYRLSVRAMQEQAERERAARQDEAAAEAVSILSDAPLAAAHDYLARKRVKPYGLHVQGDALLIPLRNAEGDVRSLQRIYPNGDKRFLAGGQIKGCFHLIGSTLTEPTYVAEGYATAATIHHITGKSVIVAFNSGNLAPVVEAIRGRNPQKIIIAADNDRNTEGNPGLSAAHKAAEGFLGVSVVCPEFQGSEGTDFNDLAVSEGDDVVRQQLHIEPGTESNQGLVGIDEMMDMARQSLPWLIKPFLHLESTVCIFGPPKQFKTFVALDMALSIATGLPFMNRWEVRRPGMAIYVAGEGVFGVSHRVRAWALHRGIPDEEFTTDKVPFYRTRGAIQISDGGAMEMAQQCEELSRQAGLPVNVIIVDTVARNFGSGNESDTRDMNQFIARCDTDIKDRFGCCTILVHHTGHNERDRPRGSMVLPGAMDGLIRVTKEDGGLIEVHPSNYKDSESPDPFMAQPRKVDLGFRDEDGDPIESIALEWMGASILDQDKGLKPDEKLVLSCLGNDEKTYAVLRDDFIFHAMKTPVQKGKNRGEKRNNRTCSVAFGRAFKNLLEMGLLQKNGDIVAGCNNAETH